MLLFVDVILNDVFEQGRNFPWPIPPCCPRCNHYKVWRHGFVERFFDLFSTALLIRRFQCPQCRCVICYRPASHFSRTQASKLSIKQSLQHRIESGRWPPEGKSSRCRHWMTNLKRKAFAYFGTQISHMLRAYEMLLALGHIPISRSI